MSTITTTTKSNGRETKRSRARTSAVAEVKPDAIRCRAYEIFLARNGGPGDHLTDWAQAERELSGAPEEVCADPVTPMIRDGILDNRS
jgi:hypothetical protein